MKKLAIVAIFVMLAALGGLAAALPVFISSESVRTRIVEQARELTGRKLSFSGNPELTFNPFLGMELRDVVLDDVESNGINPLMKVEILRGRLNVLPALLGKVRFGEFQLVRPEFNFVKESDGNTNWTFEEGKILNTLLAQAAAKKNGDTKDIPEKVEFGAFSLEDAVIHFDNAISGVNKMINHLDASGKWDNSASAFKASGKGVWEGVPVTFDTTIDNLLALVSGGKSNVRLDASSQTFTFNFDGGVNTLSDVFLEGRAKLDIPSLSRMGKLIDIPLGSAMLPDTVVLAGDVSGTLREFNIENSQVKMDNSTAGGLLQIRRDERERLNLAGTLAFDNLDLNSFIDRISQTDTPSISTEIVVDLRVSAKTVKIRETIANSLAMSLLARDGKVDADIGNIGLLGGQLRGKLALEPEGESVQITTTATLNDFQVGDLFTGMPQGSLGISGVGTADLELRSKIGKDQKWLSGLGGKANLNMKQGEIIGLDLAAITGQFLAQKNAKENESRPPLEIGGKTPFSILKGNFILHNGVASIAEFEMKTNEQELVTKGRADLKRGGAALRVELTGVPGNFDPSIVNHFFIGGTLSNPILTQNPAAYLPLQPPKTNNPDNGNTSSSPIQKVPEKQEYNDG